MHYSLTTFNSKGRTKRLSFTRVISSSELRPAGSAMQGVKIIRVGLLPHAQWNHATALTWGFLTGGLIPVSHFKLPLSYSIEWPRWQIWNARTSSICERYSKRRKLTTFPIKATERTFKICRQLTFILFYWQTSSDECLWTWISPPPPPTDTTPKGITKPKAFGAVHECKQFRLSMAWGARAFYVHVGRVWEGFWSRSDHHAILVSALCTLHGVIQTEIFWFSLRSEGCCVIRNILIVVLS